MNQKWLKLAGRLLEAGAEEFSNHGCNDWGFPKDWTLTEKQEFVKAYHEYNGDPENYNPDWLHLPDYAVMYFLAAQLQQLSGDDTIREKKLRKGLTF